MPWQERHYVRSDTSLWEAIEVYCWWNGEKCGNKRNSGTKNDIGSITVDAIDCQRSVLAIYASLVKQIKSLKQLKVVVFLILED